MLFHSFPSLLIPHTLHRANQRKNKKGKRIPKKHPSIHQRNRKMASATKQQQEGEKPAKRKPVFTKVDQLKPGTNGHTLVAKVLSSNTVLQKGRPSSSHNIRPTLIAECLIGDDTGTIIFTCCVEQVDDWRAKMTNSCSFTPCLYINMVEYDISCVKAVASSLYIYKIQGVPPYYLIVLF